MVRAFVRGAAFVRQQPDHAAEVAARYIGIHPRFIRAALDKNQPNPDALRNQDAMDQILALMADLGYVEGVCSGFADLSFLDSAQAWLAGAPPAQPVTGATRPAKRRASSRPEVQS